MRTDLSIYSHMVANSQYKYQLPRRGALMVTFNHNDTALELAFECFRDGRQFGLSVSQAELMAIPIIALDIDHLTDAIERKPDIVGELSDNTIQIGWKIPVGKKPKDLVFTLRYEITPGATEAEQRDRDFIKGLAHRVDVLESNLARERKANQQLRKQVNVLTPYPDIFHIPMFARFCIQVPIGRTRYPELYGTDGAHKWARVIESHIGTQIRGKAEFKSWREWITIPQRIGLAEPLIQMTMIGGDLQMFREILGSYCEPGPAAHRYGRVQWRSRKIEYRKSPESDSKEQEEIGYTTGHILVLVAARYNPLLIREIAREDIELNLPASNGWTPNDMLLKLIDAVSSHTTIHDYANIRANLDSARTELALSVRQRPIALTTPIVRAYSGCDTSSLSDSESDEDVLSFLKDPPEYKDE